MGKVEIIGWLAGLPDDDPILAKINAIRLGDKPNPEEALLSLARERLEQRARRLPEPQALLEGQAQRHSQTVVCYSEVGLAQSPRWRS